MRFGHKVGSDFYGDTLVKVARTVKEALVVSETAFSHS